MMGIRETLNRHRVTAAIVVLIAMIAAAAFVYHRRPRQTYFSTPARAYFTTDDGLTYFADDATSIPPFDHGGKEAVLAAVYSCDGGKHQWVQYLAKYEPEQKKALESAKGPLLRGTGVTQGLLVKRPGDANWVSTMDVTVSAPICRPACPEGMGSGPVERMIPP